MKFKREYVVDPLVWPHAVEDRLYQRRIAEIARQRNTMVILPTALGKTVISALVAAHFLHNNWGMRILVMAPTKPLVLQHRETFRKILKIKPESMIILTGKIPTIERRNLWNIKSESKIFFATPQVVRNDLASGILNLKNFSLLVFDECHRAQKNYAYTTIAKRYIEQGSWPIILATTASPGSDRRGINQTCVNLRIEQIEFRREDDTDVAPYIHSVDVEWQQVELPEEYKQLGKILKKMLYGRLRKLQTLGFARKKPRYINRKDLLKFGKILRDLLADPTKPDKGPIYTAIVLQAASLTTFHALELLETQGIPTLVNFLERVEKQQHKKKSYRNFVNNQNYELLKQHLFEIQNLEHPKTTLLKKEIEKHLKNNPSARILVFTQYRDTATYLVNELKPLKIVRARRFVGQTSKENDPGLSQDRQAQLLQNFKTGELNVLVATSIAEEGLDIPAVDLVIFYEPVPSEIRHIQRKGRTGRRAVGRTVILAAKETYDVAYFYASRKRVERMRTVITTLNNKIEKITRSGERPHINHPPRSELLETLQQLRCVKIRAQGEKEHVDSHESQSSQLNRVRIKDAGIIGGSVNVDSIIKEIAAKDHNRDVIQITLDDLR